MIELSGKKILVTGGAGFLGKNVVKKLLENGAHANNIFTPRSKEYDLKIWENCQKVTEGKEIVIHLAGNVGSIGYNQKYPATLFYDNLIMGIQVMEAARKAGVKKFVAIGTICAYPKFTPIPFQEKDLWYGYPEETNASYGFAKKMLLVQAQAYRQQYGFNAIYLMPVNLYGPGDNFNPESSHVIPALITKVADAKNKKLPFIEIWGTGKPTREFLFVEDAAEGIILATQKYDKPDPINIGSGKDISIIDLTKLICQLIDYDGEIHLDATKPDGQPKRLLDCSRAYKEFGFYAKTNFEEGLKKTIKWYLSK